MPMFVILAKRGMFKWVSGIFQHEETAQEFMTLIPEELKQFQQVHHIAGLSYPFYICEDATFQFMTRKEMEILLDSTPFAEDEDVVHYNLYLIKEDCAPKRPGRDYMGILRHEHVTDQFLEMYRQEGQGFLQLRGML